MVLDNTSTLLPNATDGISGTINLLTKLFQNCFKLIFFIRDKVDYSDEKVSI